MYNSGFFNSVDGDRLYNANDINLFMTGLISQNGVYESVGEKLQVIATAGMEVGINTGKALVNNFWFYNDAILPITLDQSDLVLNRYDAIVLRYDINGRVITPTVIKGVSAMTPVKPDIVRDNSYYDICLAYVYVGKGVGAITQIDITDTRLDSNLCGYITGLITQVDTSQLFAQWQAACEDLFTRFNAWFDNLTETLNIETYIQEYKSIHEIAAETKTLLIGIPQYEPEFDILIVNINGVVFVENTDYTIEGTGETAAIVFTNTIYADNLIECRVFKSKIGTLSTASHDILGGAS